MATKKTAASTRKTTKKPVSAAKRTTTTKVTTVKASAAARTAKSTRFNLSKAPLLTASLAEFIGTFLLASVVVVTSGQPLFIMFALVGFVLLFGGVSGGHLNPALTVGALATRRISLKRALSYIAAQVLGALLALVVLNGFIGAAPEVTEQAQAFGQSAPNLFAIPEIAKSKEWVVLAAELLGSIVFAFGVATAMRIRNDISKAFAWAGSLYVAILVAGSAASYVGASVALNPAVAAALQAFKQADIWVITVYAITPLVGGVLGFLLSDMFKTEVDA